MLNDDPIRIQVRERRQWGSERVDMVEPDGDLNRRKGQLGRKDKEISLPGWGPSCTPARQQRRF
jgi:hypothetical protein